MPDFLSYTYILIAAIHLVCRQKKNNSEETGLHLAVETELWVGKLNLKVASYRPNSLWFPPQFK
jgi:hypothetical protein